MLDHLSLSRLGVPVIISSHSFKHPKKSPPPLLESNNMHLITIVVAALTAGRLMWAMPTPESDPEMLRARATFCEKMNPPPSEEETATRFAEFADAFIFEKDIDAAFSYIAPEYIVSNIVYSGFYQDLVKDATLWQAYSLVAKPNHSIRTTTRLPKMAPSSPMTS